MLRAACIPHCTHYISHTQTKNIHYAHNTHYTTCTFDNMTHDMLHTYHTTHLMHRTIYMCTNSNTHALYAHTSVCAHNILKMHAHSREHVCMSNMCVPVFVQSAGAYTCVCSCKCVMCTQPHNDSRHLHTPASRAMGTWIPLQWDPKGMASQL